MQDKSYVSYSDFDAKGDGVTNDFFAIREAHAYANEKGLPVKINGEPTYYISQTTVNDKVEAIIIKTDTDFGRAKFIIDDVRLAYSDREAKDFIFKVASDYEMLTITDEDELKPLFGIGEGTKKLPISFGYPALVIPYNENRQVYNRYGKSFQERGGQSSPTREILLIDNEGNIDESTPFMFDYEVVTKLQVIRCDDKPITVRGGVFTTLASRFNIFPKGDDGERTVIYGYIKRGIMVSRSHTVLDGVCHYMEGEYDVTEEKELGVGGPCYSGFFSASNANEVTFKNCIMTGKRCYQRPKGGTGGTYDFSASMVNKIVLRECTQSNFYVDTTTGRAPTEKSKPEDIVLSMSDSKVSGTKMCWGIGGTNFCKNMEYYGCKLSRFDAHQGLLNGKIIDSTITFMALTGKGKLVLENTHWLSPGPGPVNNCMLYLRNDYGSTWNGSISLKNCKATVSDGEFYILQHSFINWDYGYACHFPSVEIDNLVITNRPDGAEFSFTSEWKSMGLEPNLHLPETQNVPFVHPDDKSEKMINVNPIVPPEYIRIKNNFHSYKYLMTENLPFFANTATEGIEFVLKNEREI